MTLLSCYPDMETANFWTIHLHHEERARLKLHDIWHLPSFIVHIVIIIIISSSCSSFTNLIQIPSQFVWTRGEVVSTCLHFCCENVCINWRRRNPAIQAHHPSAVDPPFQCVRCVVSVDQSLNGHNTYNSCKCQHGTTTTAATNCQLDKNRGSSIILISNVIICICLHRHWAG